MRLENSFTVASDPSTAWKLLLDVPAIAPCLPGAELTEVVGDRVYKGQAKVKVGPMLLAFAGTAEIVEIDEAARRARVRAKGQDRKGRGSARADVSFTVEPDGSGTRVDVVTDLDLVGAVAQYGRASGLIHGIAGEITSQFASNLESLLLARQGAAAGSEREPAVATEKAKPVAGLSLVWRAIVASIRRWFGVSARASR